MRIMDFIVRAQPQLKAASLIFRDPWCFFE